MGDKSVAEKKVEEIRTKIAGVNHKEPRSGKNRQDIIKQHIQPGTDLIARLEPNNPVNPNAVAIWFEKKGVLFGKTQYHLGYLSDDRAEQLAPILKKGIAVKVDVLGVTGGTKEKTSYGVNIVIRYQV